jgi:hypothetical protein
VNKELSAVSFQHVEFGAIVLAAYATASAVSPKLSAKAE